MNAGDQLRLRPIALLLTAALATALPLSGCGGSSPSPQGAARTEESGPGQSQQPGPAIPAAVQSSDTRPEVTFSHTSHDFGMVSDTLNYTHTFDFVNTGSTVLNITEVKSSCGCTSARATKDRVAPGEQGEIEVTYDPRGPGKHTYWVTVLSNAETPSRVQIHVDVDTLLVIEPRRLQLGALARNEAHTAYVTVLSSDPDMTLESVRVPHAHITAEILGDDPEAGSPATPERTGRSVIKYVIQETAAWGELSTTSVITAKGKPAGSDTPIDHTDYISISASIFGEIHAEPDRIRLGVIKPGESFEQSILMSRPSREPFQVLEATVVRSNIPGLNVRVEPARNPNLTGHRIILSGDPGEYLGPVHGSVKVLTDVAGEGPNEISFSGIVR